MHKYNLGFISDKDIYEHVKATVETYRREITLKQFNENIVDPIKPTFDSKVYGKTLREAIEDECFCRIEKSNSNRIGYFHQNIFKYAGNGWKVPKAGFNVENDRLHIYAKCINLYDSLKPSQIRNLYITMQAKILYDTKATCYLVEAFSQKTKNEIWKIKLNEELTLSNDRIRRISLEEFYTIVFGYPHSFNKLCQMLPNIIDDVEKDMNFSS